MRILVQTEWTMKSFLGEKVIKSEYESGHTNFDNDAINTLTLIAKIGHTLKARLIHADTHEVLAEIDNDKN